MSTVAVLVGSHTSHTCQPYYSTDEGLLKTHLHSKCDYYIKAFCFQKYSKLVKVASKLRQLKTHLNPVVMFYCCESERQFTFTFLNLFHWGYATVILMNETVNLLIYILLIIFLFILKLKYTRTYARTRDLTYDHLTVT